MPSDKQITKGEHYVPEVYLQGFSQDNATLYAFRIKDGYQPEKPVPIKSICKEKYLYELRDENDEIVAPNYLENILCQIEGLFAEYRRRLEQKAYIPSNYATKCFLAKDEKDFWKSYIAVQMVRTPKIIRMMKEEIEKQFDGQLKNNQARTIALDNCLPAFGHYGDYPYLVTKIRDTFENMTIAVGVDKTGNIFTSDYPIICEAPEYEFERVEKVEFPITPNLVLFLFGGQLKKEYDKNRLFPLYPEEVKAVQRNIACAAEKWIYSIHPVTDTEKEIIREGQTQKEKENPAE